MTPRPARWTVPHDLRDFLVEYQRFYGLNGGTGAALREILLRAKRRLERAQGRRAEEEAEAIASYGEDPLGGAW